MNFNEMGKLFEGIQQQAMQMEEEMGARTFTVKTGGGMVVLTANGKGEIVDLEIDDSLLSDKDSLQILLIAAFNDVNKMVEDNKKSMAMGMMGGMNPFATK